MALAIQALPQHYHSTKLALTERLNTMTKSSHRDCEVSPKAGPESVPNLQDSQADAAVVPLGAGI